MKKIYLISVLLLFVYNVQAQTACCTNGVCQPGEKYPTCPDCPCYNNMDSTGAARPFFHSPYGSFIGKTGAQQNGMCYTIPASELPGTFCFTFTEPGPPSQKMELHITPLNCTSGFGTTSNMISSSGGGGCSTANSTTNSNGFTISNWRTYDDSCNFLNNGIKVGTAGSCAHTPGRVYVVCVDISAPGSCSGVEICPVINCYNGVCAPPPECIISGNITSSPSCTGESTGGATITVCDPATAYTYLWDDQAAQTTSTAVNLSAGTYHVKVTSPLVAGCDSVFTVVVGTKICKEVTITGSSICVGTCATITPVIKGYTAPFSIVWSDGYSNTGAHTLCPATTTTYTVTVSDAFTTSTAVATITVEIPNVVTSPDASFCIGDSTVLSATGAVSYVWTSANGLSNTTGPITKSKPSAVGTYIYTVTGTTALGCKDDDEVKVTAVSIIPTADLGPDRIICPARGDVPITLTATGGNIFIWSTGALTNSIVVSPTQKTVYTVVVGNTCGTATAMDEITVNVQCELEIPNVITPNGDVHNQYFEIDHMDLYPNSRLEIYDRWGLKMYESDNYQNEWEGGNYKTGKPVPNGVYYYILYLSDKDKTTYKGFITVLESDGYF